MAELQDEIIELEDELRARKGSGWWGDGNLEIDLAERKSRLAFYTARRDEMINLANDQREAQRIWNRYIEADYSDWGQRLRTFAALLKAKGLAGPEVLKVATVSPPSPEFLERERKRQEKAAELTRLRDAVLHRCSTRTGALALYNALPNSLSEDKIRDFCREAVTARLLPPTFWPSWKLALAASEGVKALKRKLKNKAMVPELEDK
jgi:hypothetical protein